MKIALIHYHLKTGGVVSVLKHQVAVLQRDCDLLVMTGDRGGTALACQSVEIPGLGYDRPGEPPAPADRTAERIVAALRRKWPGGCDVLHIHNPLLAKNRQMLRIIERLQASGITLLLQIHDFAEDGRPAAYFGDDYPADCHYAVLNQRDADVLARAGLNRAGIHLIPNAVSVPSLDTDRPARPELLYPVRAIRRKNVGEAILLSLFFNAMRLNVTQPPTSPGDAASYRDWTAWSQAHCPWVVFEAGRFSALAHLLEQAALVITTSISEGFGLAFIEPWAAGKRLWGRRIDGVCDDFEGRGLRLDSLYDRLHVPLDWIDGGSFARCWHRSVHAAAERFGRCVAEEAVHDAYARLTGGGRIDFALLNETHQRQVMDRLIADPLSGEALTELNPWLRRPGEVPDAPALVDHNRRVVSRHYGSGPYRRRLLAVYGRVLDHPIRHRMDKGVVLDAFFDLDRFSLLQWSPYDG